MAIGSNKNFFPDFAKKQNTPLVAQKSLAIEWDRVGRFRPFSKVLQVEQTIRRGGHRSQPAIRLGGGLRPTSPPEPLFIITFIW